MHKQNLYPYTIISKKPRRLIILSILVILASSSLLINNFQNRNDENSIPNYISLDKIGIEDTVVESYPNTEISRGAEPFDQHKPFVENDSSFSEQLEVLRTSCPTWYELARDSSYKTLDSINGTLKVNTQAGSMILPNTRIEIRNASDYTIHTGFSNSFGNFTLDTLEIGNYSVIVQQDTNMSLAVQINELETTTITANFGLLRIVSEDTVGSPVDALIELRNATDSTIQAEGIQSSGNITLFVTPSIYNIIAFYGYGQSKSSIEVTEGLTTVTTFTFGEIEGKFGSMELESRGMMNMPLTSYVTVKDYTSGTTVASGTTNSQTGKYSWLLAPDVYTVEVFETNTYIYQTVTVEAHLQVNLSMNWGVLVIYNTSMMTDLRVDLYDSSNITRIIYGYISSTTNLLVFTLSPGTYHIENSGTWYSVNITDGERTIVNPQVNTPVSRISVIASPERINANDSTNITVKVTDINYDYANVFFAWTPNVGTITGIGNDMRFTAENEYTSTVTYNAPSSIQNMYIDIFADDGKNGNFSYRIYVSDRQGNIIVNSSQLTGSPMVSTRINLYKANTGSLLTYAYTNTSGLITFTGIDDDKYFLSARENNYQYSAVFELNPSGYYYNFQWGLLRVNSTALNKELIDTYVTVYNQTSGVYYSAGTTTLTNNGYYTFYLSEGVYSVEATERNSIWNYNINVTSHDETFIEFKFSVVAVYYLDDDGLPQSTRVDVYNLTDTLRLYYSYTSAEGLMVLILAPYNNYSIKVTHNSTMDYYYNVSIGPNEGQYVGQFVNHVPSITSYSASPQKIGSSESSVITIEVFDPDILDIITYYYIPSMGSISGMGANVTYNSPASDGFYYLNISVVDPQGAYDNITRSLSQRLTTININVTDFENLPLSSKRISVIDWTTGSQYTYGYTNTQGLITFSNVPESFYYLTARSTNYITSGVFIGPGNSLYNQSFKFCVLYVNSTAGNYNLIDTYVNLVLANTSTSEGTGNTVSTGTGQVRFELRPDYYDVIGLESNELRFNNIHITTTNAINKTFRWGEINVTTKSAFEMPLTSRTHIYNATTAVSLTYAYAPATTGQLTFYVAPADDYRVQVRERNYYNENITTMANIITNVEAKFGILRTSTTDSFGDPLSAYIIVRNATTDVQITSETSGTDGVAIFHLQPGNYSVTNGTVIHYILVDQLMKTDVLFGIGESNNQPSIISVIASPSRIGPDTSTIVTIRASDIDYDYGTFYVGINLSLGSLGLPTISWLQEDIWLYQIEYFSPSISGLYQLNVTLSDGKGGLAFFMLVVSNRSGTLNINSQGNAFFDLVTYITIYRVSTGQSVFAQSTSVSGPLVAVLDEDLYEIRASEHNEIRINNLWIKGGDILNLTILWGELTIYSTGPGGEPVQSTRVNVYDQVTNVRYTYAYTDVNGKVHFILAPGVYKIELVESTSIIFENIVVIGGSTLSLGSEVPHTSRPKDISYPEGWIGNQIKWLLTDTNPNYFYVTLNGLNIINATTWINGTIVSISVDGLIEGNHYAVLYMNDTTGYEQYDIVLITVTPHFGYPSILFPLNKSYNIPDLNIIVSNSTNVEEAWYQYRFGGIWSENQSLTWNGSNWIANKIWNAGTYHLRIYMRDSYGFEAINEISFTILDFDIILFSPSNNSIVKSEVEIIVSITGAITAIFNWDQVLNQSLNLTEGYSFILPRSEGLHIIEIYALDTSGDWHKKVFIFIVDDTAPEINPFDDISDGSEVGVGTSIPFSIFDDHLESFFYYWNNSEVRTSDVSTVIPWVIVPLVTGLWTLNVFANDTASNIESLSIILSILNTPEISMIYPNGGEIVGGFVNVSWFSPENLTYNLFYSSDSGFNWIQLIEETTDIYYIWDTSSELINGSTFLVRVVSTTPGKPGEIRSENFFTVFNIIKKYLPVGTTEIQLPDIDISITVDEGTNVTIQRLTKVTPIMDPNASDFFEYGLFLEITLENSDALVILTVSFSIAHLMDTLEAQGLTIFDVEVYFYNETSNQWELADSTTRNLVYFIVTGTFDHTTTIGALGKTREPASGSWGPFIIVLVTILSVLVGGSALLVYDHSLKTQAGKVSYFSQIEVVMKKLYGNVKKRFEKEG